MEPISNRLQRRTILSYENDNQNNQAQNIIQLSNDITVQFPHQPYEIQTQFMNKMVETIIKNQNGLLESPTGTGKTLSILVSILGIMKKYPQKQYQLMYLSRTHTQVKQLVAQLKKTSYNPKVVNLASRNKYCLNKFAQETAHDKQLPLADICELECQSGNCNYYNNMIKDNQDYDFKKIRDIEDFAEYYQEKKICPYYKSKDLQKEADIVFAPYAYAFMPTAIEKVEKFQKKIIMVFDEAHNVADEAEKYMSQGYSNQSLDKVKDFTEIWYQIKNQLEKDLSNQNNQDLYQNELYTNLKDQIQENIQNIEELQNQVYQNFYQHIRNLEIRQNMDNNYDPRKPFEEHISYDFDDAINGFFLSNLKLLKPFYKDAEKIESLDRVLSLLKLEYLNTNNTELQEELQSLNIAGKKNEKFIGYIFELQQKYSIYKNIPAYKILSEFKSFILFMKSVSYNLESYELVLEQKTRIYKNFKNKDERLYNLNFYCLNPSIIFTKIKETLNCPIILTSGSLKPYEDLKYNLGIKFQQELTCNHVINPITQIKAHIVSKQLYQTPNKELCFSHKNRQQDPIPQFIDLGLQILNLIKNIPNGVVIFFSSYSVLQQISELDIYKKLDQEKQIFIEPRSMKEIVPFFEKYQRQANTQQGAILLAIARGRLAEGIDFSNKLARAVMLVGIPNLGINNIYTKIKMDYLDDLQYDNPSLIGGQQWYEQQAQRTTNQCLGRIIRHQNDYGCLFFFDSRFQDKMHQKKKFSQWIQQYVNKNYNQDQINQQLKEFFTKNQNQFQNNDEETEEYQDILLDELDSQQSDDENIDHFYFTQHLDI